MFCRKLLRPPVCIRYTWGSRGPRPSFQNKMWPPWSWCRNPPWLAGTSPGANLELDKVSMIRWVSLCLSTWLDQTSLQQRDNWQGFVRPTFWTQNQDINIECLDVRVHMTHDTWASIWLVSTVSDKSRLMQVIHLRSIMLARIRVIIITWWMICLPQPNVGEGLRGQGPLLRNFRFVVMCCCVFDCTGIKLVLENLNASIIASKN